MPEPMVSPADHRNPAAGANWTCALAPGRNIRMQVCPTRSKRRRPSCRFFESSVWACRCLPGGRGNVLIARQLTWNRSVNKPQQGFPPFCPPGTYFSILGFEWHLGVISQGVRSGRKSTLAGLPAAPRLPSPVWPKRALPGGLAVRPFQAPAAECPAECRQSAIWWPNVPQDGRSRAAAPTQAKTRAREEGRLPNQGRSAEMPFPGPSDRSVGTQELVLTRNDR